jgi:hypothetical protein
VTKEMIELPKRNTSPIIIDEDIKSSITLTESQIDRLVDAGTKMTGDLGEIVKNVVAIYRIRIEAENDVIKINAMTDQIVASTRADIDRLCQMGKNVHTRGEVVVNVLNAVIGMLEKIPELDNGSRHALIDQLGKILTAVVSG